MSPGDPDLLQEPGYRKLVEELASRYSIETIPVTFDQSLFHFTRVINPGDLPLDLDHQGKLLWQPYWAEDWESSRALCHILLSMQLKGSSLLDLGCGLGLTGAVAACRGANVTLVDNAAPALEFAQINCWKWRELCQFKLADWKSESTELPKFDWIVGAEIIYDSDDWDDLEKFWRRHLLPQGGVLLCDPFRRTGKEFRSWIQKKNWQTDFSERNVPEFEHPVNVMALYQSL